MAYGIINVPVENSSIKSSNVLGSEFNVANSQQFMTDWMIATGAAIKLSSNITSFTGLGSAFGNLITISNSGTAIETSLVKYASMEITFVAKDTSIETTPDFFDYAIKSVSGIINNSYCIPIGHSDYIPINETDGIPTSKSHPDYLNNYCRVYRFIIKPGMEITDRISSMSYQIECNAPYYNSGFEVVKVSGFVPLSPAIETSSIVSSTEDIQMTGSDAAQVDMSTISAKLMSVRRSIESNDIYIINIESNKVDGEFIQDLYCNVNDSPVECIGSYHNDKLMIYDFRYQGASIEQIIFNTFTPDKNKYTFNVKVYKVNEF